jgi:hypothetical protein
MIFIQISNGNANMQGGNRVLGASVRCIKNYAATVGSMDTIGSINQGVLYSGLAANNVTTTVNYTNGNGANYDSLVISSTGVTGLTAKLAAGTLNNGNGALLLTITGTPNGSGIANFTFSFGGKTCVFKRDVINNLTIGSSYQGGIIAYVYQPGDKGYIVGQTHGIIISLIDQSNSVSWGCPGTLIGGTFMDVGTGNANTNLVVSGCNNSSTAVKICYDLNLNNYSDWYLPSIYELQKINQNLTSVNNAIISIGGVGLLINAYWSSSEYGSGHSYKFQFANAGIYASAKSDGGNVRAVRAF